LKCTKAVQAGLGLEKTVLRPPGTTNAVLGNWCIHRFALENRNAFLYMSEKTLLSFTLMEGRKIDSQTLAHCFFAGLQQLLEFEGIKPKIIDQAMDQHTDMAFSYTESASAKGSLSKLVADHRFFVANEGGMAQCDVGEIIRRINRSPKKQLDWLMPIEASKLALGIPVRLKTPGK